LEVKLERQKKKKMNIWAIIVPILIFIALLGEAAYALRGLFTPADKTTTSSSDQPMKTSASNGYVEQKGEEALAVWHLKMMLVHQNGLKFPQR
jgi:flagellar basal body-associated protein FliL